MMILLSWQILAFVEYFGLLLKHQLITVLFLSIKFECCCCQSKMTLFHLKSWAEIKIYGVTGYCLASFNSKLFGFGKLKLLSFSRASLNLIFGYMVTTLVLPQLHDVFFLRFMVFQ